VTENVALFAALLMEAHPSPASLHEIICDLHLQDRANAREAVGHEADQRTVAQTHKIGFFYDYAVLIVPVTLDASAVKLDLALGCIGIRCQILK